MQQRRLRLGDILDDYCPRERRVTNHVVVVMIDDQVKQTRCTTCDADHEYKAAKVPAPRRKRPDTATGDSAEGMPSSRAVSESIEPPDEASNGDEASPEAPETPTPVASVVSDVDANAEPVAAAGQNEEDGPVHRRLIRATLPRAEGQPPERKAPDFTVRQPGGREFDGNKSGQRFGQGRRPVRAPGGSQPPRFGGPRPGSGGPRPGSGKGWPSGDRPDHPGGSRGNRPGQGSGRGGRKRGR